MNQASRSPDWLWNTGSTPNLLFKWRRAYQAGQYEPPTLLPVEVVHEERRIEKNAAALPVQSRSKAQPVVAGVIEICVGGARVRIEGTPDAATLRIVLRTLRAAAEAEARSASWRHACMAGCRRDGNAGRIQQSGCQGTDRT